MIIFLVVMSILIIIFIVRPKDAVSFLWVHRKLACLYEGVNMRSRIGKTYILVPYLQKLIYAIVLVMFSETPMIPIAVFCAFKLVPYIPTIKSKFNPYNNRFL
jgi:hypothetical protein